MSERNGEAEARVADNVAFAILQREVEVLTEQVAALRQSTQELVDAWKAAGTIVKVVKLAATIVASIGAIFLVFKHGFTRIDV